ncbi:helix-turn-helix domain-containing protein [Cellulosilyticum lentocellum]|uniref:Helix-turn-helix domain protein n=1 Tax=Cellulosilyticum lentocellum (strain ATCC 49066 / DSM 5427 / NCIMB 11756 / RHM5) TaxID=642492 RepID=F2JN95_CELLD|nr:helix-turn-helix transcriptional regulator [Cellulosilyticum lentocellum]ADZ83549.1 helix-turn-helix domain protein [Cellulosilyticum lentocellum DSM 5427]
MARCVTRKYTTFGKEVAKKLIDLDMNNSDLAKKIGVSPMYISDILQGKRIATERKKQIAEILGLTIAI